MPEPRPRPALRLPRPVPLPRRLAVALVACAVLAAPAAAQGARVSGRVLDRDQGAPLAGAVVRATAQDTHETAVAAADEEGRWSLALPRGAGPFTLRAERMGYLPLTVALAEGEASGWRDLRLSPRPVELPGVVAQASRPPRQKPGLRTPGGTEQTTPSWVRTALPIEPGDLAALAAATPGIQGGDDGALSIFAQDPSQTRFTLDGAGYGATTVPQEALANVTVVTSAYDPSRGQFSGGAVEASTLSGTNLFGGAVRTRFSHPGMQWRVLPAAGPLGESRVGSGDGGAGGAILRDRLFWYAAGSLSRRSTGLVSLDNSTPAVLLGLGVQPDSAARLRSLLRADGVEAGSGDAGPGLVERGTGLLRLDLDLSPRHSLMLRLNGGAGSLRGVGVDPLTTPGSATDARQRGGAVLAQWTARLPSLSSELRAYRSAERQRLDPRQAAPAGAVRIPSLDADGPGSVVLRFGGGAQQARNGADRLELSEDVVAQLGGGHRLLGGAAFLAERGTYRSAGNANGTFAFASLPDLEAGRASSYTRSVGGGAPGVARSRYGAVYLGDTWTRGKLSLTTGARVEGRRYPAPAAANAAALPGGLRPGRVPSEWGVSPRVGWTYDGGTWNLRGGAGEFRGAVPIQSLAAAAAEAGDEERTLVCVGPAAPAPEWGRYADDPGAAPTACAGGAGAFASRLGRATVFAPGFAAPRTRRASVGGIAHLTRFLRLQSDASLTLGVSQPAAFDRNLAPAAFALVDEGARPVYAPAARIDPGTGGAAPAASRLDPAVGMVRQIGSPGTSSALQLSGSLSWYYPRRAMVLTGGYAFTRARDQVGALSAPGGSQALAVTGDALLRAPSDRDRTHDVEVRLTVGPRPWLRMGLLGRLTSAAPFTPRVDGDVNGDGAINDPAFVFTGSAADPAMAAGMSSLLDALPAGLRRCLQRQAGRIAGRNSCRVGMASSLDVRVDVQPWRRALDRRLLVTMATSNSLALADRALHGAASLRGWGQPPSVDPVLLRVRGFDAARSAYRYEVNPAFGTRTASRAALSRPFALTIEARVTAGADPAAQPLQEMVSNMMGPGRTAEEIRFDLARRIPNVAAQAAALDSASALRLTPAQKDSLAALSAAFGGRVAPLVDSLAAAQGAAEAAHGKAARQLWRQATARGEMVQRELMGEVERVRQVLTPGQWSRLPAAVRMPSRQLVSARPVRPAAPAQ